MAHTIEDPQAYLTQMLNRTLHVHTADGRMFVGQLKCTDRERNLILAMTHEYRQPSHLDIQRAAQRHEQTGAGGNFHLDMKKRFVGLVVLPGQHIVKIELERYGWALSRATTSYATYGSFGKGVQSVSKQRCRSGTWQVPCTCIQGAKEAWPQDSFVRSMSIVNRARSHIRSMARLSSAGAILTIQGGMVTMW